MLFVDVAATSEQVAATPRRLEKVTLLSDLLRQLNPEEARLAVAWLSGDLPQRQIGVGWAALRSLPPPAGAASLSIEDVHRSLSAIKASVGAGSQTQRSELLSGLLSAATGPEQRFLRGLLSGALRQGALAGVMAPAVAQAAGIEVAELRRAAMLNGDLAEAAGLALEGGAAALASVHLHVGRAIGPMLAQTATSVDDAFTKLGKPAIWQYKLDGARIQVHKSGSDVALFTRSLDDVTARMPEVVIAINQLPVRDLVADGEVLTLRQDGRPQSFQQTSSRVGSRQSQSRAHLKVFLFDLLHLDGTDLLDAPARERLAALDGIIAPTDRIGQLITDRTDTATAFLAQALAAGHEGVVAKSLGAPYEAGRRGAGWLKIKPVHTLDLVVLAVEWGSGRRTGKLSNVHLGALDGDDFVMLGKTFKGMTDDMLAWQTERFLQLAVGATDGWVVRLSPEQVVEVAFDGAQKSTRYPGGVALRFARVLRYRDDKIAAEADTLEAVRAFLTG